ncbi:hypothetical protein [Kitasatospora sp. GAS1066B]|uniref:hypothetical protein n=1 Tax=Kitasatospora sp. GAS1066B TaxID=3156271 RepID=UPI003512999B
MTRNKPEIQHSDALMGLLLAQGLLHSAEGASDGSWLVRRAARGPKFVLETPQEAMEYVMDVLLDVRLELETAA